jgi:hypothetical protein
MFGYCAAHAFHHTPSYSHHSGGRVKRA